MWSMIIGLGVVYVLCIALVARVLTVTDRQDPEPILVNIESRGLRRLVAVVLLALAPLTVVLAAVGYFLWYLVTGKAWRDFSRKAGL